MSQRVRTDSQAVTLDLMLDAPGPVLSSPPVLIVDLCVPLVLYPVDKFLSMLVAFQAPFNADMDIRWGPVGSLAGVTLPWVTLIPFLLPPNPLADLDLDPRVFDELCRRVREGDGVDAYTELIQERGWPGGSLHSVRLRDPGSETSTSR